MLRKATDLQFRYGQGFRLGPLDAELVPGAVTALIGPNGAGKTTLMRLFAGFLLPTGGQLCAGDGQNLTRWQLLREVAYIPADPVFPLGATVLALARWAARQAGWSGDSLGRFLHKLASTLQRPLGLVPGALSRGQRVLLAFELAMARPKPVIVADEPWASLDPMARLRIIQALHECARAGRTVLVSSHDLFAIPTIADRYVFLANGHVRWQGSAEDVCAAPGKTPAEALFEMYCQVVGET